MKEPVPVHECQPSQDLQQNYFDCVLGEMCVAIFNELVKIFLHVLKDEVQNIVLTNHFLQLHDIGVRQLFERLKLSKLS